MDFLFSAFILSKRTPRSLHYASYWISQLQSISLVLIFSSQFLENEQGESISISMISTIKRFILDYETLNPSSITSSEFLALAFLTYAFFIISLYASLTATILLNLKKMHRVLAQISKTLSLIHVNIIFLPSTRYLLSGLEDRPNDFADAFNQSLNTSRSLVIFCCVILIGYAFIGSLFSFQPLKNDNLLSRRFSFIAFIDVILKLIFCFGLKFENDAAKWLCSVLPLVIVIMKQAYLELKLPYHHFTMYKIAMSFNSFAITGCFLNLLNTLLSETTTTSVPLLSIILSPILAKCLIIRLNERILDTLDKNTLYKSDRKTFEKYLAICDVFQKGHFSHKLESISTRSQEEAIFLGIMSNHSKKCENSECFCKIDLSHIKSDSKSHSNADLERKLSDYKYEQFKTFFTYILSKRTKNNNRIKILYVQYLINERIQNFPLILSLLHSILLENPNILLKYKVKMLQYEIQEHIKTLDSTLNLTHFVNYQRQSELFQKSILEVTEDTLSFWSEFQQPEPKFVKLLAFSRKVNIKDDKIKARWAKLKEESDSYLLKEYPIYASYCSIIRNSGKESYNTIKEYEKLLSKMNYQKTKNQPKGILQNDKSIIITISMAKKNIGSILAVSDNIHNKYGWRPHDLHNSNVNVLMPEFLQAKHDLFLLSQIETGETKSLFTNNFVFGESKSGYLVPQTIYLAPHPNLECGFCYMGVLTPSEQETDYIILNEQNKIVGFTESVANLLALTSEDKKQMSILDICPDYAHIFQVYSIATGAETTASLKAKSTISVESPPNAKNLGIYNLTHEQILESYQALSKRGCILNFVVVQDKKPKQFTYHCIISEKKMYGSPSMTVITMQQVTERNSRSPTKKTLATSELKSLRSQERNQLIDLENTRVTTYQTPANAKKQVTFFKKVVTSEVSYGNELHSIKPVSMPCAKNKCDENSFNFGNEMNEDLGELEKLNVCQSPETTSQNNFQKLLLPNMSEELIILDKQSLSNNNPSDIKTSQTIGRQPLDKAKTRESVKKFQDILDGVASICSSSNSRSKKIEYEYEGAIREKPRERGLVWQGLFFLGYFLITIILFLYCNGHTQKLMQQSLDTAKLLRMGSLELFNLIEIARRERIANWVERGIVNRFRHITAPDFAFFCIQRTVNLTVNLLHYNNELINFYHKLDESLYPELFNEFQLPPRREGEPPRDVKTFEAMKEFATSSMKIVPRKLFLVDFDPNDPDMKFILDNALNDPVVGLENMLELMLRHMSILNDRILNSIKTILIIFVVLWALTLIFSFRIERDAAVAKGKIFASLMRIEEPEYQAYSQQVLQFYTKITGKQPGERDMSAEVLHLKATNNHKKRTTSNRIVKIFRTGDKKRMHYPSYQRILMVAIILSPVLVAQAVFLAIINKYSKEYTGRTTRLWKSDRMLTSSALWLAGFYDYMNSNGTSELRGKSILPELNREFEFFKDSQSLLVEIEEDAEEFNSTIKTLMHGDLCVLLAHALNQTICYETSQLAGTTGMTSINAAFINHLTIAQARYEDSDRSPASVKQVITSVTFLDGEGVFGIIFQAAYLLLDEILTAQIEDTVIRYQDTTNPMGPSLTVICVVLLLLSYVQVYRKAYEERFHLKKILSMIPMKIIMSNPQLKNYLTSVSDSILSIRI